MSAHDENKVGSKDADSSLFAVDSSLYQLAACPETDIRTCLSAFAESILAHLGQYQQSGLEPIWDLFDQGLSYDDRRFIAACLIRLLSLRGQVIESDSSLRIKCVALFDDALEPDVYPQVQTTKKQQTYEKLMRLKDAATHAETQVEDVLSSSTSLDQLDGFRQQLMKVVNAPLVKALVLPFLPRELLNPARMRELFMAIEAYRDAPVARLAEQYNSAMETIDSLLRDASAFCTAYSERFLVKALAGVRDLVAQDFASSVIAQPAHLVVRALPKKYPLREAGHDLQFGFVVENAGPGHALEVALQAHSLDNIRLTKQEHYLGSVEPGSLIVDLPGQVVTAEDIALIEIRVQWQNLDGSAKSERFEFELQSQQTDIDWNALEFENPYSLEPVESYRELVGRREIVGQLVSLARARSTGSAYIYGQKRVGKTSIAKALRSRLSEETAVSAVYLEGGEYIHPSAEATISRLGTMLCERVRKLDQRLAALQIPAFEGALVPLADFLESAHDAAPELKIVFILDEFDELPIDLYRRSPLADSFFLTLRTISGKQPFGFVLVGGEKMEFIMSCQGDALNKFQPIRVDYFDRQQHWSDYRELVTRPTREWLEFSDDAVVALYEQSAGNPFYTVHICRSLFQLMLQRRDSHVTWREVDDAVSLALHNLASNSFQHFWEDGIFEPSGDKVEEISIRRRRILLALADTLRAKKRAHKEDIAAQSIVSGDVAVLDSELQRFSQRRILVEGAGFYDCKVPFFRRWLLGEGVHDILTTFSDLGAILERRRKEEQAYVRHTELSELLDGWSLYQGRRIGEEQVRAWLEQFGDYANQRLMFRVLQCVSFYSDDQIRAKLREAHGIIRRSLAERPVVRYGRQRKVGDVLISYLDAPGKSGGGRYAKLYADENSIYFTNVVERNRLAEAVIEREGVQAIVFIDDFIGTGKSAQTYFKQVCEESGAALKETRIRMFFVAITGFRESTPGIARVATSRGLQVDIHLCDPLDSSARCFSDDSRVFPDPVERQQARQVAYEFGSRGVRMNPLGFGDCQALVVFPDDCPNNDLAILWASSDEPPFYPLFKRPMARR